MQSKSVLNLQIHTEYIPIHICIYVCIYSPFKTILVMFFNKVQTINRNCALFTRI